MKENITKRKNFKKGLTIEKRRGNISKLSSRGQRTFESWFWMREQNGTKKFLKKVLDRAKKKCYNKRVAC